MLPEEKLSLALQRGITARENILFPGELIALMNGSNIYTWSDYKLFLPLCDIWVSLQKKNYRVENAKCIPNNGMFRWLKYNQA